MSKRALEWIAGGLATVILTGWAIFWTLQIIGVIDLLKMAYG